MIRHVPVLVNEVYKFLPYNAKYFVDGTLGHGGHTQYMIEKLIEQNKQNINVIGIERDKLILEKTKNILKQYKNIKYYNCSYSEIDKILEKIGTEKIDYMLLDLGVNMEHFKDYARGFSIKGDNNLDMRFDIGQDLTAEIVVNSYSLEKLNYIFTKYGDFKINHAQCISDAIVKYRLKLKIKSTYQLKDILKSVWLNEKKIAVIFQCLRIEVNKELDQLEEFLNKFKNYISVGGRCSIITYHSIEDRIVKNAFKKLAENGDFKLINKHVIKPKYTEQKENKSSRSAKLRVIQYL